MTSSQNQIHHLVLDPRLIFRGLVRNDRDFPDQDSEIREYLLDRTWRDIRHVYHHAADLWPLEAPVVSRAIALTDRLQEDRTGDPDRFVRVPAFYHGNFHMVAINFVTTEKWTVDEELLQRAQETYFALRRIGEWLAEMSDVPELEPAFLRFETARAAEHVEHALREGSCEVEWKPEPSPEDLLQEDILTRFVVKRLTALITEEWEKDYSLHPDVVRRGIVTRIVDFGGLLGAMIDLGGVQAFLSIRDMSQKPVRHPSELLAVDQEVEVQVLELDRLPDGKIKNIRIGLKGS